MENSAAFMSVTSIKEVSGLYSVYLPLELTAIILRLSHFPMAPFLLHGILFAVTALISTAHGLRVDSGYGKVESLIAKGLKDIPS
jgi:hypothetical protein